MLLEQQCRKWLAVLALPNHRQPQETAASWGRQSRAAPIQEVSDESHTSTQCTVLLLKPPTPQRNENRGFDTNPYLSTNW